MPRLGPAFLHQPITGLTLPDWRKALDWQRAGMRIWAPRRLREYRFMPKETIIEFDGSTNISTLGTVEKSLLGEQRLVGERGSPNDLPTTVTLQDSLIFETMIDLPTAARATLADAVAMRLDEISPIPPEDASFAIGALRKSNPGRLDVEVAITKKSSVNEAIKALAGRQVNNVGAAADATGKVKYSFKTFSKLANGALQQWPIAAAVLVSVFIVLAAAFNHRASVKIAALEVYENDLISEARRLRADADKRATLAAIAPTLTSLRDVQGAINEITADIPDGGIINQISFANDALQISGLTPIGSAPKNATPPLRRTPSAYPSYEKFQTTRPMPRLAKKSQ
ncbi:MAG: hypothetical protein GXP04_10085 [Alphaproteobacteria bacterium]|nr:hypothetical protein [Alphaproteobacteria bacterium]